MSLAGIDPANYIRKQKRSIQYANTEYITCKIFLQNLMFTDSTQTTFSETFIILTQMLYMQSRTFIKSTAYQKFEVHQFCKQ